MKIGLVSYEFRNNDIPFNLSQMKKAVARTRGEVDLLCFGETFLQGFDSLSWSYNNDKDVAISLNSDIMEKICGLSLWGGMGLLFGYIERDGESLYSSCALADQGNVVHNYRRISKGWKEYTRTDSHYQEGASAEEFTYRDRKFMIALCGDLWDYPEQFRTDGVLLWPVYVGFSLEEWHSQESAYAEQSSLAARQTLMVNSVSTDPKSYGGAFYFKNGSLVSRTEYGKEDVLIVAV